MLDKRQFYINGQWVDPIAPNDLEVINPSNEEVCAIISLGSSADTDLAIESANKALPLWSKTSKDTSCFVITVIITNFAQNQSCTFVTYLALLSRTFLNFGLKCCEIVS